jgi:hypothetical protein
MGIMDAPGGVSVATQTSVESHRPMAEQLQKTIDSPTTLSFEEGRNPAEENLKLGPMIEWVNSRYQRSKQRRYQDEQRWLEAYRNFRGIYGPDTQFTSTEKSRLFIKITKTKVLAAYAQVVDVLFAGNKFPIGIEPTPVPNSDTPDAVHLDTKDPTPPDPTTIVRPELLGAIKKMLAPVKDKLKEGPGLTPNSATWEPLKIAAKKMERKIQDQLSESDAGMHLRNFAFELCLLGTGVIKGPFAYDKEYPDWDSSGQYIPKQKTIPRSAYVSIWNCYPDAEAINMKECDSFIERHKMSRSKLRDLKKRHGFRPESIDAAIMYGPNYVPEYWESILDDNRTTVSNESYEVLEFWGVIDKETAVLSDLPLPNDLKDDGEIHVNAWVCNNQVLRLIINPFTPRRIPYHACPYELNPYSFFGIGVAENMSDSQQAMNGMMRLVIDNAALSSNVILEVNETNLVPGQTMEVFPGKIFKTQGAPGQSIWSTKFDNVTNETLQVYDKFRQLADEATSMPSYAHGGTGINQVGRTAAGMQMLMGAADKTTKAVVKNIDDYILAPWGKDHFSFNMQFDFDPELVGDLDVVALGTQSLLQNEARGQKLLQFFQIGAGNPLTAPFMKIDYILRELATSLDLDEEKVVNDPRAAMVQAMIMAQMNPQGTNGPPTNGAPQVGNGAANGTTAPQPGQPGFSGTGGGDNGGPKGTPQAQPPQQGATA